MIQVRRDWEACSTNHENGVEDKAIHGRQSSRAWSQLWAEVNSAQRYGVAELRLKHLHDYESSGDESQSKWLILQQPDSGDLLATVRIDCKSEFRIEFDLHNAGWIEELGQQSRVEEGSLE